MLQLVLLIFCNKQYCTLPSPCLYSVHYLKLIIYYLSVFLCLIVIFALFGFVWRRKYETLQVVTHSKQESYFFASYYSSIPYYVEKSDFPPFLEHWGTYPKKLLFFPIDADTIMPAERVPSVLIHLVPQFLNLSWILETTPMGLKMIKLVHKLHEMPF